jgi:hypothetical protein
MSDLTPAIVGILDEMNDSYQKTAPEAGGFGQVGWPPANSVYPAIVKSMTVIAETKVFAGKGNDPIKCPAIRFSYETLPDVSDPTVDPENAKIYKFEGVKLDLIPPSALTGDLADTSKGIGWVLGRNAGRLKGILAAITGDEDMPLPQAIATVQELIEGDAAVGVNLFIDKYDRKDKNTDTVIETTYTEFARGGLDISDFDS